MNQMNNFWKIHNSIRVVISEAIATYSSRRHLYSTGRMNSFALSLRTIKLRQFNICYATETRFSSSKQDLLSSKQPPDPSSRKSRLRSESKRASLFNHYALESVRRRAGREVE